MARLFELAQPAARNGKKVIVACVEGEHHEFPARLVADYLDLAGFDVKHYGADLPTEHLVNAIVADRPDVAALSVTMSFNIPALRRTIVATRAALPAMPIVIGGHVLAWSPDIATELGVATADADPESVVEVVGRLASLGATT